MYKVFMMFVLSVHLFTPFTAASADLSESSVKNLIAKVDQAIKAKNANKLGSFMSNDVVIVMNISSQGQRQVMRPSKAEYIAMLNQGWSMYTNYRYNRSNLRINIQGNKALVTANVRESMSVQGQSLSGNSREQIEIKMVNGALKVTQVIADVSM